MPIRDLAIPVGAITSLGTHFYNLKYHPEKLEKLENLQASLFDFAEHHNATAILETKEAPEPSLVPYDLNDANYASLLTCLEDILSAVPEIPKAVLLGGLGSISAAAFIAAYLYRRSRQHPTTPLNYDNVIEGLQATYKEQIEWLQKEALKICTDEIEEKVALRNTLDEERTSHAAQRTIFARRVFRFATIITQRNLRIKKLQSSLSSVEAAWAKDQRASKNENTLITERCNALERTLTGHAGQKSKLACRQFRLTSIIARRGAQLENLHGSLRHMKDSWAEDKQASNHQIKLLGDRNTSLKSLNRDQGNKIRELELSMDGLKKQHQDKITDLMNRHKADIASKKSLIKDQGIKITELEVFADGLRNQHRNEIMNLTDRHKAEITDLTNKHQVEITSKESLNADQINQITELKAALDGLKIQHQDRMVDLENKLKAETTSKKAMLKNLTARTFRVAVHATRQDALLRKSETEKAEIQEDHNNFQIEHAKLEQEYLDLKDKWEELETTPDNKEAEISSLRNQLVDEQASKAKVQRELAVANASLKGAEASIKTLREVHVELQHANSTLQEELNATKKENGSVAVARKELEKEKSEFRKVSEESDQILAKRIKEFETTKRDGNSVLEKQLLEARKENKDLVHTQGAFVQQIDNLKKDRTSGEAKQKDLEKKLKVACKERDVAKKEADTKTSNEKTLQTQLAEKTKSASTFEKELTQCKTDLSSAHETLKTSEEALKREKTSTKSKLEKVKADRESSIQKLQSQVKSAETQLEAAKTERDEAVKSRNDLKTRQHDQFEQMQTYADQQIAKAKEAQSKASDQAASATNLLKQNEAAHNSELAKIRNSCDARIEANTEEYKQRIASITDLHNAKLAEVEKTIKEELSAANSKILELDKIIARNEDQIEQERKSIAGLVSERDSAEERLRNAENGLQAQSADFAAKIAAKDTEINEVKDQSASREAADTPGIETADDENGHANTSLQYASTSGAFEEENASDDDQDDSVEEVTATGQEEHSSIKKGKSRKRYRTSIEDPQKVLDYESRRGRFLTLIETATKEQGYNFQACSIHSLASQTDGWTGDAIYKAVIDAEKIARNEGSDRAQTVTSEDLQAALRNVAERLVLRVTDASLDSELLWDSKTKFLEANMTEESKKRTRRPQKPEQRLHTLQRWMSTTFTRDHNIDWSSMVALTKGFRALNVQEAVKRAFKAADASERTSISQSDLEAAIGGVRSEKAIKEIDDAPAYTQDRETANEDPSTPTQLPVDGAHGPETANEAPSTPTRLPVVGQGGHSFPNTPDGDHPPHPAGHLVENGFQGIFGSPDSAFGQPPANLRRDPQDSPHWHILPDSNGSTTPDHNLPRGQTTGHNVPSNHPPSGHAFGNHFPFGRAAGDTPRIYFPLNQKSAPTASADQPKSSPGRKPFRPSGHYTPPAHRQNRPQRD